jgi:hypothetical protein
MDRASLASGSTRRRQFRKCRRAVARGRVLLSFAQFEREVIGERVRDKIAASKRKGLWVAGPVPIGYRCSDKKLEIVPEEAEAVRTIFTLYLELANSSTLKCSQTVAMCLTPRLMALKLICFASPCESRFSTSSQSAGNRITSSKRSALGRTGLLNGEAMHPVDAYRMIQRRAAELGMKVKVGCHTFRATGITAYSRCRWHTRKRASHSGARKPADNEAL